MQKASISRHFKTAVGVKLLLIICECVHVCECVYVWELLVFIFTLHPFFVSLSIVAVHTLRIFAAVAFGLSGFILALMTGALCNWNLLH